MSIYHLLFASASVVFVDNTLPSASTKEADAPAIGALVLLSITVATINTSQSGCIFLIV
jgi:hypothetical protein